ncbi:hypothetical protein [Streptomyces sp. TLI_105]|uniref:hypothetical protein n=1 Tax=Streptomyces sp. TLI_105 TaxID=1881019 RepID=UPI000A7F8D2A
MAHAHGQAPDPGGTIPAGAGSSPAILRAPSRAWGHPCASGDAPLERIVSELHTSETPPLSYRELSLRFRAAGHSTSETRLRAAWRRVTTTAS